MDQPISALIREKLVDGRLPHDHFPRIRSRPGNGEICDGCELTVTRAQTMMESLDAKGCRVQFHVGCYYVWVVERQVYGQLDRFSLPSRMSRAN
jgi:hypothetical protein